VPSVVSRGTQQPGDEPPVPEAIADADVVDHPGVDDDPLPAQARPATSGGVDAGGMSGGSDRRIETAVSRDSTKIAYQTVGRGRGF
jgi:hypothetical protein